MFSSISICSADSASGRFCDWVGYRHGGAADTASRAFGFGPKLEALRSGRGSVSFTCMSILTGVPFFLRVNIKLALDELRVELAVRIL